VSARSLTLIVLVCVFGSALLGIALRQVLPRQHLDGDAKDIVKLGLGLVSTLAALVLGLLVSSTSTSFNATSNELAATAVKIVQLDRTLSQYGPETAEVRSQLAKGLATAVDAIFSNDRARLALLDNPEALVRTEGTLRAIRGLSPQNDEQRELRSRALGLAYDAVDLRWPIILHVDDAISTPVLVVLASWLCVIFLGWGLFASRTATLVTALFIFAGCASGAIFLILELDGPFTGWVRISDVPMRTALAHLNQ
jgi:hypothetical protein